MRRLCGHVDDKASAAGADDPAQAPFVGNAAASLAGHAANMPQCYGQQPFATASTYAQWAAERSQLCKRKAEEDAWGGQARRVRQFVPACGDSDMSSDDVMEIDPVQQGAVHMHAGWASRVEHSWGNAACKRARMTA